MFAYDTKLVATVGNIEDCMKVQHDLDNKLIGWDGNGKWII